MKTHQAHRRSRRFSIAAAAVGVVGRRERSRQARAAGPFTEAQATAGQAAYAQSCAGCHGRTLTGAAEAPRSRVCSFMRFVGAHGRRRSCSR